MAGRSRIRTDLALEATERFQAENVEVRGVEIRERYDEEKDVRTTVVRITTENGARTMGKPQGTAGGIGTAAGILCLSITTGGKSSSLLMIAGMTSYMGILLNGIYQMCDHGSLISEEMPDSFFL